MRPRHLWWAACAALVMAGAGCGDDDGTTPTDAGPGEDTGPGPRDAGVDSGPSAMDAGMDAGRVRPLPECDPYAAESGCEADEKCSAVRDTSDTENLDIFFGCVSTDLGSKEEGIPCGEFGQDISDTLSTDDCASGLFCWRQAGIPRCRPLCGDDRVECPSTAWCSLLWDDPIFGVCETADDCDPVFQTGCAPGDACYIVSGTMDQRLATCIQFRPADGGTGAPGEACRFLDSCQPGTQCLGTILPDGGAAPPLDCKSLCATGGAPDAGTPMDGGVADAGPFTGDCTGALTCTPIPGADTLATPTGACQ